MTALSINPAFPIFTEADGQPLENGYIWIGTANLNPITNPIAVYWDAALSAPATQPIRTLGGYPSNSGTPARLYVNSDYSIQVLDRKGSVVYSAPVATERYGGGIINAADVVYDPAGTGAVATTLQATLRRTVFVDDFGASASASAAANDTAFALAVAYAKANNCNKIEFTSHHYSASAEIAVKGNFGKKIIIEGNGCRITSSHNGPIFSVDGLSPDVAPQGRINLILQGFTLVGPGVASTSSIGVKLNDVAGVKILDVSIEDAYKGLYGHGCLISSFENIEIHDTHYALDFDAHSGVFAPNDLHFKNVKCYDNVVPVRGYDFPNSEWSFEGCELEGNNQSGTTADGVKVIEFSNAGKVTFQSCHIEDNPGQYGMHFSGVSLSMIGCENIPGDDCGNVLYMSSGHLNVVGSRITNNVTTYQIVMNTGATAFIVGDFGGYVMGDFSGVTRTKNGKFIVGEATATATGNGVTFPATQNASSDANTLDDYQEDTWTPVLAFGGGSTGITYSVQNGRYTKVGRVVTVSAYIALTSKGSSTGNATITGLPIASINSSNAFVCVPIYAEVVTNTGYIVGYINPATSEVKLSQIATTGVNTRLTDTNFANNSAIMLGFSYFSD